MVWPRSVDAEGSTPGRRPRPPTRRPAQVCHRSGAGPMPFPSSAIAPHPRHHRQRNRERRMAKPVHAMIRVRDEARSLAYYGRAFGLAVADRYDFPDFTLDLPARSGLAVRDRTDRQQGPDRGLRSRRRIRARRLHRRGSVRRACPLPPRGPARDRGEDLKQGGAELARFFFATDPDGYKIEVIQRGGRFA